MSLIWLFSCVLVGVVAIFILVFGYFSEIEKMEIIKKNIKRKEKLRMEGKGFYEVKIFDGEGNLKNIISQKTVTREHWARLTNYSKHKTVGGRKQSNILRAAQRAEIL